MGVGIMACLLIAAVVWGYRMRPSAAPCTAIRFIIEDKAERQYVTENELHQVLIAEQLDPVGQTQDVGALHRIEQTILHHPMVRTAECYRTPRNEVRVRVTQRVPLLKVQTPGETYFIDTDRRVMQARAVVQDKVLVATGTVGVQMASSQLADLAEWLQDNAYWQQRIHHVHMASPRMVYVYVNDQRVLLGTLYHYERKLKKLRTFLENSVEATQDKHYYELDLRFRGQVIGRWQEDKRK